MFPPFVFVNFNSIKVRLILYLETYKTLRDLFQFHKGSINTTYPATYDEHLCRFQFHKGSINTHHANQETKSQIISIP